MNIAKRELLLLVAFLVLLAFPLQYICRWLDLSTLTSWRWVFAGVGPAKVFVFIALCTLLALPLSGSDLPEKHPVPFLSAAAIVSSIPFLNSPEVMLDSARYFLQAKFLALHGIEEFFREWGGKITPWTDLPLIPMIYGLLYKVFGESKLVIAIFNILLFSLIPVLTYYTGKLLWQSRTGFIAGILILASPYLLTQVPLMLVDIHTMFFLLLAVCTFLYTLERGGFIWPLGSAIAIVLALFTKYSTWPMLGVLAIITLIRLDSQPRAILKRCLAVAALITCLLGLIYLWKGSVIMQQLHFLRTYQMAGLKRWQEGYLAPFFFQVHPYIIPAALFGVYRALVKRDKKILIMGWFAALVFILELKRVRYLLPLLPFLTLTGAYGLQGIKSFQVQRFGAYCCLASSLVIALMAYRPFLAGTGMANLKDAGEYLNTLSSHAVEIYCLPQNNSLGNTAIAVPIIDLYTDKIIYQEQPWNSAEGLQRAQNISLRFSWELKKPEYYRDKKFSAVSMPLVIIASEPISTIPSFLAERYPAVQIQKQFTKTSGVFRYQTFVSVFTPL